MSNQVMYIVTFNVRHPSKQKELIWNLKAGARRWMGIGAGWLVIPKTLTG